MLMIPFLINTMVNIQNTIVLAKFMLVLQDKSLFLHYCHLMEFCFLYTALYE